MSLNPPVPTAFPVIKINSSTGSDTAASGAGPSTALSGTNAAVNGTITVTLLVDNPNLSGVATDGTACMWVGTASGRQFSKITGVNNTAGVKTVTVAVAYDVGASTLNWGIGGKRATAAGSPKAFVDWGRGWWIDQQTNETIAATILMTGPTATSDPAPLYTSTTTTTTWGSQPVIDTTTNSLVMFNAGTNGGASIANLAFKQTSGTPGIAFQGTTISMTNVTWSNCIFDGLLQAIEASGNLGTFAKQCVFEGNEVKNCTSTSAATPPVALNPFDGPYPCIVTNNFFHDNGTALFVGSSGTTGGHVINNVFANNTSASPIVFNLGDVTFKNNTIYNCGNGTSRGAIESTAGTPGIFAFENNIFYGCPGYALKVGTSPQNYLARNNAYGGNNGGGTGADLSGIGAGINDLTGISNPFVSGSDFGLAVGSVCRAAAVGVPNASANPAGDLGAIPSGGGAASGGCQPIGRSGGLINAL